VSRVTGTLRRGRAGLKAVAKRICELNSLEVSSRSRLLLTLRRPPTRRGRHGHGWARGAKSGLPARSKVGVVCTRVMGVRASSRCGCYALGGRHARLSRTASASFGWDGRHCGGGRGGRSRSFLRPAAGRRIRPRAALRHVKVEAVGVVQASSDRRVSARHRAALSEAFERKGKTRKPGKTALCASQQLGGEAQSPKT